MKINAGTSEVFDQNTREYDQWFEKHANMYQSEIMAIEQALPKNKSGIEIGVGTGRFAMPFNIKYGIEPSENMARVAEQKGIKVYRAYAEDLPIGDAAFDFVLMVTTVCFLTDIPKAFSEIHRILKPGEKSCWLSSTRTANSAANTKRKNPQANFTGMPIFILLTNLRKC